MPYTVWSRGRLVGHSELAYARVYPDMFSLAQAHHAWDGDNLMDAELRQRLDRTLGCFLDLVEATKHYPKIKKVWVEFLGEHPDAATDRVEESEDAA